MLIVYLVRIDLSWFFYSPDLVPSVYRSLSSTFDNRALEQSRSCFLRFLNPDENRKEMLTYMRPTVDRSRPLHRRRPPPYCIPRIKAVPRPKG
jgi:hypothetical protein